jgi:CsoR family transcriptional regulator, copper-sensing transcriptional repressor
MSEKVCSVPRHDAELDALSRIEGQVRGIRGMVVEGRYCVDILTQIRAVHAALRRVERNVLKSYLETCVQSAFSSDALDEREEKVRELLTLFDWENGKPR